MAAPPPTPYPAPMAEFLDSLDLTVDRLLARVDGPLRVGAPAEITRLTLRSAAVAGARAAGA